MPITQSTIVPGTLQCLLHVSHVDDDSSHAGFLEIIALLYGPISPTTQYTVCQWFAVECMH